VINIVRCLCVALIALSGLGLWGCDGDSASDTLAAGPTFALRVTHTSTFNTHVVYSLGPEDSAPLWRESEDLVLAPGATLLRELDWRDGDVLSVEACPGLFGTATAELLRDGSVAHAITSASDGECAGFVLLLPWPAE